MGQRTRTVSGYTRPQQEPISLPLGVNSVTSEFSFPIPDRLTGARVRCFSSPRGAQSCEGDV